MEALEASTELLDDAVDVTKQFCVSTAIFN